MKSALIVAFDGLQPSQVTPVQMPNLSNFAAAGVAFDYNHAVFPTVTRINAASLVTGRYPGSHGLAANTLVVRDFDPNLAFSALEPMLAKVAAKTGRVLLVPTMADVLSRFGKEFVGVGTGTTGNSYMHNPNAERVGGATIHPEFCLPYSLSSDIAERFGPWPEDTTPNTKMLSRGVDILTEYVLPSREPAVSLIWFSEPDHAQHAHGVGSDVAKTAIFEADAQFGRLLKWLADTGREESTDMFVVSDHGYSTVLETIDVVAQVRDAGFPEGGEPGGVVVAPNGGSVLFYCTDSDPVTADRLASWLMAQPWCGALIASEAAGPISGTVAASEIGYEGERAPELAMSFRWDSETNDAGFAGRAFSTSLSPGKGQHGSMSPHETRNILFARGPSFKSGIRINHPTGNIDVAPTILHNLGLGGGEDMDGRVLHEALIGGVEPEFVAWKATVHEAERRVEGGSYGQAVKVTSVGKTTYVDEGQGWGS